MPKQPDVHTPPAGGADVAVITIRPSRRREASSGRAGGDAAAS